MQDKNHPQSSVSQPPPDTLLVGHSVAVALASAPRRLASATTDSSITLAAWLTAMGFLQAPLQTPLLHLTGALTLAAAIRWLQRRTLGSTLGDRLWGVRAESEASGKRILRQAHLPCGTRSARGFFTILTVFGLPGMSLLFLSQNHPTLMEGSLETLTAQPPPSSADWPNLPFYYLLGPWPSKLDEKPVTYSLPYAKGPPQKFLGSILIHWRGRHEATLQLEGPRTPASAPRPRELRNCFTPGWKTRSPLACIGLRENALKHSLDALRLRFSFQGGENWKMGWFETPETTESESSANESGFASGTQGIHVRAENRELIEDHYVIVTPSGTHQPVRLTREANPQALETESLFLAALAAQKVQKDIQQSRAWADQLLASVELASLKDLENQPDRWAVRAAEIEAFLISKLTVDPTAIEPFFHLGGIATLFARHGVQTKKPEWTLHADTLLHAVIRYARDVAPKDSRVPQLERLRAELQAPGDQVAPRTKESQNR